MTRPRPPALVLFDVDGTLLITRGMTTRCIERACRELLGPAFAMTPITAGTLDHQIYAGLVERAGLPEAVKQHAAYKACYLRHLESELASRPSDVMLMPGVAALIERLRGLQERGEVVLGLLTGNYGEAVALKLSAAGLRIEDFRIHAFAEHGEGRDDLVAHALQRFAEVAGVPADRDRTFVLGDTPRDIACARAHGCVAVAVATGRYRPRQLDEADLVLEDLGETSRVLAIIAGESPNG